MNVRPRRGLLAVAAVLALAIPPVAQAGTPGLRPAGGQFADFGREVASPAARHVADWVADSRDSAGSDFLIVDKKIRGCMSLMATRAFAVRVPYCSAPPGAMTRFQV